MFRLVVRVACGRDGAMQGARADCFAENISKGTKRLFREDD